MNDLQTRQQTRLKKSLSRCYYSESNSIEECFQKYPDPTDPNRKHRIPQIIDDKGNVVGRATFPRDMLELTYWECNFQGYMTEKQLEQNMKFKVINNYCMATHFRGSTPKDAILYISQHFNLPVEWVIDTLQKYKNSRKRGK